ncbi:MAG: helix-turn-helix transcriptional regulator [Thermoplasmata archaeon]|nr:helix-turn-helix transcriptional regulator [Thermoplasmata archaeon]
MISSDFLIGILIGFGVSAAGGILFWWLFGKSRVPPETRLAARTSFREVDATAIPAERSNALPAPTSPSLALVTPIHPEVPELLPSEIRWGTRLPPALPEALPRPRPAPEVPPPSPTRPREELRTSYRVLLHIARQGRVGPSEIPPWSLSQGGMVEGLAISQGALTGALARLVSAGILEVERGHVRGHDRRVKVYRLTPKGEQLVRDLRTRVANGERNQGSRGRPGVRPGSRR